MPEFLFMLTKDDSTVPDCLEIYDSVRDTDLRWVGFKDIGVPIETLRELTRRIHEDHRKVVLEIVSIDEASELQSLRAGIELKVDLLMGGTRPEAAVPLLEGKSIQYFPFPGRIVGHPSVLEGTLDEIAASAEHLTSHVGVDGLDLLAYRWGGDVPALISAVVAAARGPIVVAGSIVGEEQINVVANAGAWGFTIGGAVFDRVLVPNGSVRDQVDFALRLAEAAGESLVAK